MSAFLFLIFVISPLMLLLLYPATCCQKCLSHCGHRNSLILHTFVDAFQGHFKDGTEPGTRDCRWFAAVYFLDRIIVIHAVFIISEYVRGYTATGLSYMLAGICLILYTILIILSKPYKSIKINSYHALLTLIGAIICFLAAIIAQSRVNWIIITGGIIVGLLSTSPLLFVIVYVVIYSRLCHPASCYYSLIKTKLIAFHADTCILIN